MTSSQSKKSFIYSQKYKSKKISLRSLFWKIVIVSFCGVLAFHVSENIAPIRWNSIVFSEDFELFQNLVVPDKYNWIPIAILLVISSSIIRLFSPDNRNARSLTIAIFSAFTVRYILWRTLYTLNLSNSIDSCISISFLLVEFFLLATQSIRLFLTIEEKNRHQEADLLSVAVLDGSFQPTVDIFIPTYDEPAVILRRTIIGCQAIHYDRKSIYILDDTRRSEIADLAKELGCEYITRSDNRHAKAGNLNHAIAKTNGDLIIIFDADFIPTQNFIERTAGFFQDRGVGLIQTHQCFYNSDIIARNLGLEEVLPHEFEMYYRQYQLMRDGARSVLCSGSAFMVRRSALEDVGGFVTESLCEDYYTGVSLAAQGYEVIYLDENLSAGLIAESMPAYLSQRQRWARGTLQGLFLGVNPFIIEGLTLRQRICNIEGIMQWFANLIRMIFLLMPLAYYFLGILPLKTTIEEWLFFFLP
ncbi:glycosyltransferase, partial [Oscillatoriales cyanobacterium LEGE 11467]|nr:glycosyltransferase [Zarconia navalis LEGE 11467]